VWRRPTSTWRTEVATITYLPEIAGLDELARAIEAAARGPPAAKSTLSGQAGLIEEPDAEAAERAREQRSLGLSAAVALGVAAITMGLMYAPSVPVTMEQLAWVLVGPATFVQFWAGRRFYRAAWRRPSTARPTWTRSSSWVRARLGPSACW